MLKNIVTWSWLAVAPAALYVGYIFYARYDENQRNARQAKAQDAKEAEKELDLLGGTSLKINQLYAPATIAKGSTAKLCYGVVNAATVTLDPPVERVWPALTRCIEISPKATTDYTLTAKDAAGHAVQQTVSVQVH